MERWNTLKQQQAQKRIIEHLMYSGKPEEEPTPTARSRLANKVKNKQQTGGKKGGKNKNKNKEFDVEKTLRSVLGSDYKPQKGKKNKKKKETGEKKLTNNNNRLPHPLKKNV